MSDPALNWTVAHLAADDVIRWHCACQVRTLPRRRLVRLVGQGERLHLIGLRRELWCDACGDVLLVGQHVRGAAHEFEQPSRHHRHRPPPASEKGGWGV